VQARILPDPLPENILLLTKELGFAREDENIFTNINLTLQPGECLYITGENGAGKSTLLQCLAGILLPATGHIFWRNQPLQEYQLAYNRELIYLGHQLALKPYLTVREQWSFYARQEFDTEALAARWQLQNLLDVPLRQLSEGQRRRVALGRLNLQPAAAIWLLDEPYVALDASSQQQLTTLIQQHLQQKGAVILTSHQMAPFYTKTYALATRTSVCPL
jgi:heme exporter protein A